MRQLFTSQTSLYFDMNICMKTIEMEKRIQEHFPKCQVIVLDLTGTEDHFEVRIHEPSFEGLPRIQQHKKIMGLFSNELQSGEVHALAIKTLKLS